MTYRRCMIGSRCYRDGGRSGGNVKDRGVQTGPGRTIRPNISTSSFICNIYFCRVIS